MNTRVCKQLGVYSRNDGPVAGGIRQTWAQSGLRAEADGHESTMF